MRIGLIGTGLMGLPMAHKILEAGFPLTVFNRSPAKADSLRDTEADLADSVGEVIDSSDCVILMLSDANAIDQVLFEEDLGSPIETKCFLQMGTISPSESRKFQTRIADLGGYYFEAPVLGSIPQVKSGELIVMAGGSEEQFSKWFPLLEVFGPNPILVGEVGQAAAVKLAMNQLIGTLTSAFSASLGLILKNEVDVDTFMEVVRGSALYAPTFDKKLERMLERNFENPNFPTKHLLKDVQIFLDEAQEIGLDAAHINGVVEIAEKACEAGLSDKDYSAVYNVISPDTE